MDFGDFHQRHSSAHENSRLGRPAASHRRELVIVFLRRQARGDTHQPQLFAMSLREYVVGRQDSAGLGEPSLATIKKVVATPLPLA